MLQYVRGHENIDGLPLRHDKCAINYAMEIGKLENPIRCIDK